MSVYEDLLLSATEQADAVFKDTTPDRIEELTDRLSTACDGFTFNEILGAFSYFLFVLAQRTSLVNASKEAKVRKISSAALVAGVVSVLIQNFAATIFKYPTNENLNVGDFIEDDGEDETPPSGTLLN